MTMDFSFFNNLFTLKKTLYESLIFILVFPYLKLLNLSWTNISFESNLDSPLLNLLSRIRAYISLFELIIMKSELLR